MKAHTAELFVDAAAGAVGADPDVLGRGGGDLGGLGRLIPGLGARELGAGTGKTEGGEAGEEGAGGEEFNGFHGDCCF